MLRRILLSLFLLPFVLNAAIAQGWPTRQIQTLVPQSPGSALDIVTRAEGKSQLFESGHAENDRTAEGKKRRDV